MPTSPKKGSGVFFCSNRKGLPTPLQRRAGSEPEAPPATLYSVGTLRGTDLPPTDPRSDDELVAAANAGDSAAFEALYDRYRDWAVGLAWRFAGDREEALDVVQRRFCT